MVQSNQPGSQAPRIGDRPIEAGVYSWGWVDYRGYGPTGRPQSITVVMFKEPTSETRAKKLYRLAHRSRLATLAIGYGPLLLGFFAMATGVLGETPLAGYFTLAMAAWSCWNLWSQHKSYREIYEATEFRADSSVENYIAGKAFLRALGNPALMAGDIYAFFDLRVSADELSRTISDVSY